jgi:hypothetical protein
MRLHQRIHQIGDFVHAQFRRRVRVQHRGVVEVFPQAAVEEAARPPSPVPAEWRPAQVLAGALPLFAYRR